MKDEPLPITRKEAEKELRSLGVMLRKGHLPLYRNMTNEQTERANAILDTGLLDRGDSGGSKSWGFVA